MTYAHHKTGGWTVNIDEGRAVLAYAEARSYDISVDECPLDATQLRRLARRLKRTAKQLDTAAAKEN